MKNGGGRGSSVPTVSTPDVFVGVNMAAQQLDDDEVGRMESLEPSGPCGQETTSVMVDAVAHERTNRRGRVDHRD